MMSPQPTPPDPAPPSATTTPILPLLPPPPDPSGWPSPLPSGELPGYPPPPYPSYPSYPSYPPYQPPLPLYPPYPGYMPYYPGPMAPSTSYWAIASLACTLGGFALIFFLGVSFLLVLIPFVVPAGALLGVICGHVALVDISRSRGRLVGRGMALAGLITGYVILALALFLGIVAFVAAAARS